ncbi:MAG: hypothetical protein IPG81_16235 [Sandaracinaceae bacterium]|nr:hypothetical protein [Sandaracinaceae bacterium]
MDIGASCESNAARCALTGAELARLRSQYDRPNAELHCDDYSNKSRLACAADLDCPGATSASPEEGNALRWPLERALVRRVLGGHALLAEREQRGGLRGGFLGFYLGAEGRCVCMVTGVEPRTETPDTQGWVVPHSVCLRYREIFPDTVACRDQAFELIP